MLLCFFFSSRIRQTRCALVTGVQACALPICGVRLWPVSTPRHPKPFVRLAGTKTLLQVTAERVTDPSRFTPPLVVCNKTHRFLVAEQLQQIGIRPQRIVLEPSPRNTAPEIGRAHV